jgi:hypothetical protein
MGRPFSFKEIFATTFKNGQLPTLGHIEKNLATNFVPSP